ncbi:hypothetical protein [Nannocystis pusilla]|uniref:Uncharacterized protein n=1 Tax=Nannocystis pusilla TaxID=889268 RepID=A0ABS7U484_9BACT|nr:hypothetical protein [Nannocystis pusilla]MBZ5715280.1 hypothetical protein [Nannocystis pusilla]
MNPPNFRFRMTMRGVDSPYPQDGTFWCRPDGTFFYQLDTEYLLGEEPHRSNAPDQLNAEAVKDLLQKMHPEWHLSEVAQASMPPGKFHPRVWRQKAGPEPASMYGQEFTSDIVNFELLERDLESLFQIIEPYKGSPNPSPNEMAFGHGIRRLLILACTEVENLLKRVMLSHGCQSNGKHWSTNDYVKTYPVLKLGHISSRLVRYPDYPPLQPFHGWGEGPPSQSLDWYNAYNATKHDRMEGLKEATFSRALNAVAAVHVLLTAQYGIGLLRTRWGRFALKTEDHHSRIFENVDLPLHPLGKQYIPPFAGEYWSPSPMPPGSF